MACSTMRSLREQVGQGARAGAVGKHLALERAVRYAEALAEHALEHGARVERGTEIAAVAQIARAY